MRNIVLALVLIVAGAVASSAQTTLYFPQFIDGSQNPGSGVAWVTAIGVTNPATTGTATAAGSITLTADNGSLLNLGLFDENGNPIPSTFQLAPGQTKFFLSPQSAAAGTLSYSSGFATLTSTLPVTAQLVLVEANQAGTFATAGVPAVAALTKQGSLALVEIKSNSNSNLNVGIAVANPNASTANLFFQLLDKTGAMILPQVTRAVAANNHTAFFITDLFPNAPKSVFGSLHITSDLAVATTALFFNGVAFGTIPIFPLN